MVIRRWLAQDLGKSCFGGVLGMVLRVTLISAKGYDRQKGTWIVDKRVYAEPMTWGPSWVLQSTFSLGQGQSGCRFALPLRVSLLYSREFRENTFKSHICIFIQKKTIKNTLPGLPLESIYVLGNFRNKEHAHWSHICSKTLSSL